MSKETKKLEILCSRDYDKFKPHKMQRGIRPIHLARIEASMKRRGFKPTKPIIVTSKLEVLDGQHRLEAAKSLGIDFYYVISDDLTIEDIRDMAKTAAAWDIEDYIVSQIRQENDNYWRLMALKEKSGLNWNSFMGGVLMLGDNSGREELRSGEWVFDPRAEADAEIFLERFEEFRGKFAGWNLRQFVTACRNVFKHPQYDHKQMKEKLEYLSSRLHRCSTTAEYIGMIADIYNYRSHTKNIVDFVRAYRGSK